MNLKFFKYLWIVLLLFVIIINTSACANSDRNRTHRLQWWLKAINWDVPNRTNGLSGKGVLIAVIDTAVDRVHPDLVGKIVEQHIVEGVPEELRFEHGTAVAGIICASPNNKDGVLGIAVDAQILSIVIINSTEAQIDSLIKGIEYAITKNVDIINISAGIILNDPRLQSAIDDAYNAGIIIVAASGNSSYGEEVYPAKYDNVISVGSVDSNGKKLFGGGGGSVFLPGGNIVTTYSSIYEPKKYINYTGTSTSSPMLTGVIALILEQHPNLSNKDIVSYFRDYQNLEFDTVKVLEDFKRIYNSDEDLSLEQ